MIGEPLIACASCGCHARLSDAACPHCGHVMRRDDGSIERTAAAALLGLAALALPIGCQTGAEPDGVGGASSGSTRATAGGNGGTLSSNGADTAGYGPTYSSVVSSYGPVPTGDTFSSGTSPGDRCGTLSFADPACSDCGRSSCCVEMLACDYGTACESYLACISNCETTDDACFASCGDPCSSVAKNQADALIQCLSCQCTTECGFRAPTAGQCGSGGAGGSSVGGAGGAGGAPPGGG